MELQQESSRQHHAWCSSVLACDCLPRGHLSLFAAGQEDRLLDLIMLQLRLSDGLDLQAVQQQYGQQVVAALVPCIQDLMGRGLMQLAAAAEEEVQHDSASSLSALQDRLRQGQPCRVRLTDPKGFLLSNDAIAKLFAVLDPSMLQAV